jgi:hypothetical protein
METFQGLPAHPLFVHAPLVLMPLLALATIPLAVRPAWRRRFGPALAIGALVLLVTTILAVQSGEAFEEAVEGQIDISHHRSLAEAARLFVALYFLGTAAGVGLDRFRGQDHSGWADQAARGFVWLAAVLAGLGTVWMMMTGHEGARLVWDGVR